MAKVLILYYSAYGHIETMANAVAEGVRALNPVFDVTPAALIDAIVTERGVLRAPFDVALRGASASA